VVHVNVVVGDQEKQLSCVEETTPLNADDQS